MGAGAGAMAGSSSAPGNRSGPSPLGQDGVQYGLDEEGEEDSPGNENAAHFKTLVYRSRRPSDMALVGIMLDPIVSHHFRDYLYSHFKEALYNFWVECNSYAQIFAGNVDTKKAAAAHIYGTFLAPDATYKSDFRLDDPTVEQIAKELKVSKPSGKEIYVVKQNTEVTLRDVFKFAAGKVFQILKYDYLNEFIVSEAFQDLYRDMTDKQKQQQSEKDEAAPKRQRRATRSGEDEIVDIEYVISQESGRYYFLKFVRGNGLFEGQGQFLFDLLSEIDHYTDSTDPATQMRRLKKICERYAHLDILVEMENLITTAKKNNYREPDPCAHKTMLSPILDEIMTLLENYALPFKLSKEYKSYKQNQTEVKSHSMISKIQIFADDRKLKPTLKLSLQQVLHNRIGRAYFKEYAEKNLMEESIAFWIEVQNLKIAIKTHDEKHKTSEDKSLFQVIHELSEPMIKTYIEEDSEFQVNISDAQREATLAKYKEFVAKREPTVDVFDIAEKEILDLLKRNLWNGFKKSDKYKYLAEKVLERTKKAISKLSVSKTMENLGI